MNKLFLFLAMLCTGTMWSQVISNLQHPSISEVSVVYRVLESTEANATAPLSIPECSVKLKTSINATKIYLTIKNPSDNTMVYEVNYSLGSSAIVNSDGKKVFENLDGVVFISNAQAIEMKPYLYELRTEDSASNSSPVYSEIK